MISAQVVMGGVMVLVTWRCSWWGGAGTIGLRTGWRGSMEAGAGIAAMYREVVGGRSGTSFLSVSTGGVGWLKLVLWAWLPDTA